MREKVTLRDILARNVKAALVRRKKSVVAVADFAGVSVAHLYDLLRCRKAATVDIIEKVAGALGVEPADLLQRDGGLGLLPKPSPMPRTNSKSSGAGRPKTGRAHNAR